MSDERKGTESAQLFVQKGFENLFLLSGGFDKFAKEYPDMIEGKHVIQKDKISPKKQNSQEMHKNI